MLCALGTAVDKNVIVSRLLKQPIAYLSTGYTCNGFKDMRVLRNVTIVLVRCMCNITANSSG